jgi:cation:H+ antiporter
VDTLLLVVGGLLLYLGAEWLVAGASRLATSFRIPELLVGLTVIAAVRGHSDIAVGNVVGSNIFNNLLCLGLAGVVAPISAQPPPFADLGALLALTVAALGFLRRERIMRRVEGGYCCFSTSGSSCTSR